MSFDCYANKTLLYADGKFNKEIAKAIYKNYTKAYAKSLGEDPWLALLAFFNF